DQKHLVGVGLRVVGDLVSGKWRARRVASGRIADHPREIADQENNVMSKVLQLAELVELDRIAEMEVGTRGTEPSLDLERLAARQLRDELGLDEDLLRAPFEHPQLVPDAERHHSFQWTSAHLL